jgi:hypothetical protein
LHHPRQDRPESAASVSEIVVLTPSEYRVEEKHCALIVDENIERRARLILAMRAASLFATIHVARSLEGAELRLSEEPVDIVFVRRH